MSNLFSTIGWCLKPMITETKKRGGAIFSKQISKITSCRYMYISGRGINSCRYIKLFLSTTTFLIFGYIT